MDSSRTEIAFPVDWEMLWAPYDGGTYQAVLGHIRPEDIVLEIGAGDLRLARQAARIARRVEAIEIQEGLVDLSAGLPANLVFQRGDARTLSFAADVTLAILLMRHCSHYPLYVQKLRQVGCRRLVTNARWRMNVELVQLDQPRRNYFEIEPGWFACECGLTGFKPGPAEKITPEVDTFVFEIFNCPNCQEN